MYFYMPQKTNVNKGGIPLLLYKNNTPAAMTNPLTMRTIKV